MRTGSLAIDPVVQEGFLPADQFRSRKRLDSWGNLLGRLVACLLAPLVFVVAALFVPFVLLSSNEFPTWRQKRAGFRGQDLWVPKFSTMNVNSSGETSETWFGRIIRPLGLDEILQILLIAKGNMQWFGPRPFLRKDLDDRYIESVLLYTKPGFFNSRSVATGIGNRSLQRGAITVAEMIRYDRQDLENWSVQYATRLFLRTILVMIRIKATSRRSQAGPGFEGKKSPARVSPSKTSTFLGLDGHMETPPSIASTIFAGSSPPELSAGRLHHVHAGQARSYDVYTAANLSTCTDLLADLIGPRSALVVTTPTVAKLFARDINMGLRNRSEKTSFMVLRCNEATKTVEQVLGVCERAQQVGLDRSDLLIGIGGGICTDIVTVAASWIRRSIGYIRVPTTLVGQVDAGIGIKGAVNFCQRKSYLGCFHPPRAVIITPPFLKTLPRNRLREGFAEIIKMAVIRDERLFEILSSHSQNLLIGFDGSELLLDEILSRSIRGMFDELQPNIYEDISHQRLVDFGHTFSPALEVASHYSISHGEAVAIDVALSAVLATKLGIATPEVSTQILRVLLDFELPTWSPFLSVELCEESLRDTAMHRGGQPNLVVPQQIGTAVFVNDVAALASFMADAIGTLKDIGSAIGAVKRVNRDAVLGSSIIADAQIPIRRQAAVGSA
jgi:2-epi-5-epi-valiolone synthase